MLTCYCGQIATNTDHELIELYKRGSKRDAIAKIYRKTVDEVYRYIYSRVGDRDIAQEITSETYMAFIEVVGKYDDKSKLTTFIIGIAVNKIRQYWTKKQSDGRVDFDEEYLEIDELDEDEVKEHEKKMNLLREKLDDVLKQLSETYKEVLTYRFLEGMDLKETARKMNISYANVRTLQHRALGKAAKIANNLIIE